MKRRGLTLVEVVVVLAVICILAVMFTPIVCRPGNNGRSSSCQSQLKQIGLGFRQYTQDYDERLPLISVSGAASSSSASGAYGWVDALQPYIKSTQIFHCPTEENKVAESKDAVQTGFTDYWMNTNLSGANTAKIKTSSTTILLGDGNDGVDLTDARYNRNSLPQAWIDTEDSPARRHLDGGNYAFADGHVKWLKPQKVKITRISPKDYSFEAKLSR